VAGDSSSGDDSVPLVSSKLAARLSQDRGTPQAAGKHKDQSGGTMTCKMAAVELKVALLWLFAVPVQLSLLV
jgi:hypothetical protein